MTFKAILVHAEPLPAAAPRLATAAAVARDFGATLLGVGAEMLDWVGVSDPYGIMAADWMTVMRDQVENDLKAAEAAFLAAAAGLPQDWIAMMEPPVTALSRLSRGADLIVAGGAPLAHAESTRAAAAVDLVMRSGRPVLVAPPSGGALSGKKVIVAWKDTREARRAVADAMPFLTRADQVLVMAVCTQDTLEAAKSGAEEVAQHLQRHGVKASARSKIAAPERVAAELNIEAQALGADLIVSGAYGHSRLQEWVMGGVTYDLLHHPETFVLLSH
jgi:nucleotide-binding universal stress UspA family protein